MSLPSSLVKVLAEICPKNISTNVLMAKLSNWRVGGYASVLVTPTSVHQLIQLRRALYSLNVPYVVIGNTTNLLFTDENIDAVIIQIGPSFSKLDIEGEHITAQAGIWVPLLARKAMQAGLSGLEHTCGIPGTLGGLVVMNGGSQRKGIGDNIVYVSTVAKDGRVKRYSRERCEFDYRNSIFQNLDEIIVEVGIELSIAKDRRDTHNRMLSILRERNQKFPRKQPNCGSVFVSNPAMYERYGPPGKVIEECGLKGTTIGGAQVSNSHANFIVNTGNATAENILDLIKLVREQVLLRTGYLMVVEAKYVTVNGVVENI